MKEVEIKAKIKNLASIKKIFKTLGVKFIKKTKQIDDVYIGNNKNNTKLSARIRLEKKIYTLTVKEKLSNPLDNNEYEFEITNPKDAAKLLVILGFKKILKIKKTRSLYKYKKKSICLDHIASLGNFIEVEKIVKESADSQLVQEEIGEFLKKLGITKNDHIITTYFDLILRKKI